MLGLQNKKILVTGAGGDIGAATVRKLVEMGAEVSAGGRDPTKLNNLASATGYWGRRGVGEPFLKQMPLGRWATEDEIAWPIVFLLSEGASMITGVSLPVDGGFNAC